MKDNKPRTGKSIINIKDIIIVILIIIPFTFIDVRTALSVGVICISLILVRGVIRHSESGHANGCKILPKENELYIPKGVEVFELAHDVPMEVLYMHISVLRAMEIRPKILIVRFRKISQMQSRDAHIIKEEVRVLSERKISVFISEANAHIKNQFLKYDLDQKISSGSIFYKIDDALKRAETMLNVQ